MNVSTASRGVEMRAQHTTNYAVFLLISDMILTLLSWFTAIRLRYVLPYGHDLSVYTLYAPPILYFWIIIIWPLIFVFTSAYDYRRTLRFVDELQTLLTSHIIAMALFASLLYLFYRDVSRLLFVYFVIVNLLAIYLHRAVLRGVFRWLVGPRQQDVENVLIIGAGKVGRQLATQLQQEKWTGLTVIGFLDNDATKQHRSFSGVPVLGRAADVLSVVRGYHVDEVIFALPLRAHRALENMVLSLQSFPVRVHVVPDYFDLTFFRATVENYGGIPLIGLRDPAIDGFNRLVKRVFDLVVGGATLIVVFPLMLLIALLVKVTSPGPVIFQQQRVGENGRIFTMYKFRSMVANAETLQEQFTGVTKAGAILHKKRDDPRITTVGRFLRHTSLDELPQLFNVLKGNMSLVGPRPELPSLVEKYEAWQHKRFAVPPGITGWWQINGRSDHPMQLHTEDDLYYIQHYSPLLDAQILWRTIGVVLKGKGAY